MVVNDKSDDDWGRGLRIPIQQCPSMFGHTRAQVSFYVSEEYIYVAINGNVFCQFGHRSPLPSPAPAKMALHVSAYVRVGVCAWPQLSLRRCVFLSLCDGCGVFRCFQVPINDDYGTPQQWTIHQGMWRGRGCKGMWAALSFPQDPNF